MSDDKTDQPQPNQTEAPSTKSKPQAANADPAADATAELEALVAENADMRDRLLRTMADMENLRRRTERELLNVLERHGVTRIDPKGQRFDPNCHQAMYEVPDPSVPEGTVVDVMQSGYVIGDRCLRPALVAVAKGGPKAPMAKPEAPARKAANEDFPEGDADN